MMKFYKKLKLIAIFLFLAIQTQAQINYNYGWEPTGLGSWTTSGATMSRTTTTPCTGVGVVRANLYSSSTTNQFTSPNLGVVGADLTIVQFDYKVIDWSGGGATPATFGVIEAQWSNSGAGPWTTFFTINSSNHSPSTSCAKMTASFTPTAGNLFIRFSTNWSSGDYYLCYDNVNVVSPFTLPAVPTSFVATAISSSQIDLTWVDNATNETNYTLQYSTSPTFTTSTTTTYSPNSTSASITGLLPNTQYYFNLSAFYILPSNIVTATATTFDVPKTITTFTITQAANQGVAAGTQITPVIKTRIQVQGSLGSLPLNTFAATSLNTDEADITAIKLYVTTSTTFANTTLLASATGYTAGTVVFSGINYDIPQGDNYFWLTYDVSPTATFGNILDAQIDATFIDIDGTQYPAINESPVGKLWIDQVASGPFSYDFEGGASGFTTGIVAGTIDEWQLGTPSGATDGNSLAPPTPHSGTKCWGTNISGLYSVDGDYALYSPVFQATSNISTFSYWEVYSTESCCDELRPQYKINGGAWVDLAGIGYRGIQLTWQQKTYVVSAGLNSGDNIQYRLYFNSDVSAVYNGFYIDDITITNVQVAASSSIADAVKPTIVYSPLSNGAAGTTRALASFAQITDNVGGTGVDLAAGKKPRVYYKKTSDGPGFGTANDSSEDGWKWVEASNSTTPFDFTIDYSKLFGVLGAVDGDIIQYFVVAQDSLRYPAFPAGGNVASNVSAGFVGTAVASITSAPTSPLTYTIAPSVGPITYTISSTGDYNSISNAGGLFEAINTAVIVGNITAVITEDLSGETGDVALNVFGNTGAEKMFIVSDGLGVKTISGNSTANPTGLIRFNGAKNVLVDGGASKELVFVNDATNSPVLSFRNDCSMDSITNSVFEGSVTSATNGLITIGTGYSMGNKNISITNNTFKDNTLAGNTYINGIYSQGTSSVIANGLITISGNDFVNFSSNGINVTATGNGAGWLIQDNHFYNDATLALTTAITGINFKSGSGNNQIKGNFIGGTQAMAGGTHLVTTANVIGIDVTVANGAISTEIYNNTIKNIRSTVATLALNNNLLNVNAGSVLVRKNTVGSNDVNERIELNGNNRAINIASTGDCQVDSNLVANITSISNGVDDWDRFGIFVSGTGNANIDNNTISDLTNTEKDFGGASALTYAMVVSTSGVANITNNYIFNISSINSNSTLTNYLAGIDLEGTTGMYNVAGNRVYNVSSSTVSTATFNQINGIQQLTGGANIVNNIVAIKDNVNSSISGIVTSTGVSTNLAHNAVYLSGASNVNVDSYGILRTSAATVALRNNLIYNGRTVNTGTASHYALGNTNATPSAGWAPISSSNNALIVSDLTKLGKWGTATVASTGLAPNFSEMNSKILSSVDAPAADLFVDAANFDMNIDATKATACLIANIGASLSSVPTDINGAVRSTSTPDPGAYEFAGLVPANITPITGSALACAGASAISYSTSASANATEYVWTFSTGISLATTGLPSDAISVNVAPGTTTGIITVAAKNGCGLSNTETKVVTFDNSLPTASFSSSTIAAGVAAEMFTDNSTNATGYNWNFGDGASSTLVSPSHAYTANGPFTVTLTVSNGCGTATDTKTVQFTVGTEELTSANFSGVTPNPTTDKFVLTYNNEKESQIKVEVSNIAGQVVYTENVENYKGSYHKEINLTGNATGMYFVKVVSNNNVTTHKVILN